ncbi:MAG: galactose mutarotase [Acidimicrobiia bacterium]|nr:galactose mutarotase [Acidimicrobiia bacterium]
MDSLGVETGVAGIRFGGSTRSIQTFALVSETLRAMVWDQGATLVAVELEDGTNLVQAPVVGDDLAATDRGYRGSTIGRYANRIANARFSLGGTDYPLDANDGLHTLHGGEIGFDQLLWRAEPLKRTGSVGVRFSVRSPDGDQGFPGNLDAAVTYWLTAANELVFEYEAVCDAPTVVAMTNHAYWNLAGQGTISEHILQVNADRFVDMDELKTPTEVRSVAGTRFDFRLPRPLSGPDFGDGYDHCLVLEPSGPAAVLMHGPSGRRMMIETDQPGLQVYTANNLQPRHCGIGLETQALPNSPNRPDFPSVVLRPGETYRQVTRHRFS